MNADNHSQCFSPWGDNVDTDCYTILTFKSSNSKQNIRCSHDLEGSDSSRDRDDDSICIQELTDDMEDFIWLQEFLESSIRGENLLNECTLSTYEINGCMNWKGFHDSFIDTKEMIFTDETRRFLKENDEINEDEKSDESLDYFNDSILVTKQRKKKKTWGFGVNTAVVT
jgi:hypothetical protein